MWLARSWLAEVTLGPEVLDGSRFYALALATMVCSAFGEVFDAYLRVQKWSGLYVSLSLVRLLLNIALNVYFLVGLHWGILGLLTGNLLASVVNTLVLFVIFRRNRGRCVMDRGIGFAPEEANELFTAFYRTEDAKRMVSGLGIGLSACRLLVDLLGGRLWALPRPGGGAEFGFGLPAAVETAY